MVLLNEAAENVSPTDIFGASCRMGGGGRAGPPAKLRAADLSAKHLRLVTKYKDLDVLAALVPRTSKEASQCAGHKGDDEQHPRMLRSGGTEANRSFRPLQEARRPRDDRLPRGGHARAPRLHPAGPASDRYRLGLRLVHSPRPRSLIFELVRVAWADLRDPASRSDETVTLGVLSGDLVVYVDQTIGRRSIDLTTDRNPRT